MSTAPNITNNLSRMCSNTCNTLRSLIIQEHSATRYRSRLWFVLPLTLNLLGGIVAYMAIRYDDPDKAKNCLLLGIIIFGLLLLPFTLMGAVELLHASNGTVLLD